MAFAAGGKGLRSDINVTPLIDVVLVLLIVFIVLVPKLLNQMTIDVPPKAEAQQQDPTSSDQLVVSISDEGTISINKEVVTIQELPDKVRNLMQNRSRKLMFFDPSDGANYGLVAHVMDLCRGGGVKTIGIMTK